MFEAESAAASHRSRLLARFRITTFIGLLAAGLWAEKSAGALPVVLTSIAAVVFITLVVVHGRVRRRGRRFALLAGLNRDGLHRLSRQWNELAERPAPPGVAGVREAHELSLFGRPALAQLLGPTVTSHGRQALAALLSASDDEPAIRGRQDAVRDLAGRNDFRDRFAADGTLEDIPGPDAVRLFLEWAGSDSIGVRMPVWVTLLGPAMLAAALGVVVAGLAPTSVMGIPLLMTIGLTFALPGRTARHELARAFGHEAEFRAFPLLFQRAGAESFASPLLQQIARELRTGPFAATEQMRSLARLAHLAGLRSSGMLYLPVQLATLWDFHVLRRVDRWRMDVGPHVRDWFEALGRLEALSAIATLAHDHPDWPFPDIGTEARIEATAVGHPMIDPQHRVDNDVNVGPPGTFLLVTGSNMSGKSTLLRAIGLNLRLAMAGAPVCAAAMTLPRATLRTSFHVEDSLTDGVSLFMAQLRRVKAIVDAARDAADNGTVLVYLMDEMLAGTNTAERRIAATRVIRHLVELGAIGAVTTHDLALAGVAELQEAAIPVHFRETVHPGREQALSFDYRLREGVATSTNALRLMEIVGLGD